jgi:UDPglucose--hexose-1-phosphate uridylyltransferase
MSETRYDWLSDRWVIFAPSRLKRPDEFIHSSFDKVSSHFVCPFCSGNEHNTPDEVLMLPPPTRLSRRWQVRVVPNKFPALDPIPDSVYRSPFEAVPASFRSDASCTSLGKTHSSVMFQTRALHGAHEVIIESPNHTVSFSEISESHSLLVLEAYRRRLSHWRAHDSLRYAVVFKNVGTDAGASLSHAHSQLIATSFVPPDVRRSCQRLQEYSEVHDQHYFEELIEHELDFAERIVIESENFVCITPYASPVPYFVSILPKKRRSRFEEIDDSMMIEFNKLVRKIVEAVERLLPNSSYNFVLHTGPYDPGWDHIYHWRLELFPRITKIAGFEWGSNCYINPVLPETAAAQLSEKIYSTSQR